jgi:hypothetical protein
MLKVFDSVPKLIATISIFVLTISVLHDWGYFWVVGSKFQQLQTSYDFIANSIDWLPIPALFSVTYAIAMFLGMKFAAKFKPSPSEGFDSVVQARLGKQQRRGRIVGVILVISLTAILIGLELKYDPLPDWAAYSTIVVILALTGLALFLLVGNGLQIKIDFWTAFAVFFATLCFGAAFYAGAYSAVDDLYASTSNVYTVELKSNAIVGVKILRTLEKGLLQYNPLDRTVSFLRWDEVKTLRRQLDEDDDHVPSFYCSGLGLARSTAKVKERKEYRERLEAELASWCVPTALATPKKVDTPTK